MLCGARGILLAAMLTSGFSLPAAAQDYPARQIEFLVPWDTGGGADQVARKLATLVAPKLKVSLPIVNLPGANGQTGLEKMLSAPADGYSMSVLIADTVALQAGAPRPRWTMSEIVPLGIAIQQASAFLVAEGGKFKNWADVEKTAKAETVRVAMLGFGSADDLTINYYVKKKGLKFVAVPLAKPSERYAAILGGQADVLYEQLGDVRTFIDSKQMKPVLLFATKRDETFKDVPTSVELGDKVTLPQFRCIVVRAGTDPKVVKTLSDLLSAAAKEPDYVKYLADQYADPNFVPVEKARPFLDGELTAMRALVAQVGMTKADPAAPTEATKN
jgi:putative tricarboxylic transport membrane protein